MQYKLFEVNIELIFSKRGKSQVQKIMLFIFLWIKYI
jgi:hypothetical protein